jgi:hypothetical protein
MNEQSSFFSLMDEVAPYYGEPIQSLCQLLDIQVSKGMKIDDLKSFLLERMNKKPHPQENIHNRCTEYVKYYPN